MKTLDEYLALPYRMELTPDPDEGGYVVSFPDLPGCLSVGETIDEAVANAEDAKREWLAAAIEDGYPIKEPNDIDNYSGQFKLRIPKSLHKSLSVHAKEEGCAQASASRNQLILSPACGSGFQSTDVIEKIWCSLTALPTVQQEFVRISTASSASENRQDLEVRFIQNMA